MWDLWWTNCHCESFFSQHFSIIPPVFYIYLHLSTPLNRTVSNDSCMTSLDRTNWVQWQHSSFGINASLARVDRTIFLGRCWNASALRRVCLVFNLVNPTYWDTWGAVRSDLRRLRHRAELIATLVLVWQQYTALKWRCNRRKTFPGTFTKLSRNLDACPSEHWHLKAQRSHRYLLMRKAMTLDAEEEN